MNFDEEEPRRISFSQFYQDLKSGKGVFVKAGPWLCMVLIILHALFPKFLTIDFITVSLFGTAVLIPIAHRITKLKVGDIEAEIDNKIRKIEETYSNGISDRCALSDAKTANSNLPEIETTFVLWESDPQIAIAKMRILIEKEISRIYEVKNGGHPKMPLRRMIDQLQKENLLSQKIAHGLYDVIAVCNEVIHGGSISKNSAFSILTIGAELLSSIRNCFSHYMPDPINEEIISKEDERMYHSGTYKVTSIIPYVYNPLKITRIIDQAELSAFLDGYQEYAEYIVSVEKA